MCLTSPCIGHLLKLIIDAFLLLLLANYSCETFSQIFSFKNNFNEYLIAVLRVFIMITFT